MISFSDQQLQLIMAWAGTVPVADRTEFLELIASQLKVRDVDVRDATERALRFLRERRAPQ
jgi:hypothetical protein